MTNEEDVIKLRGEVGGNHMHSMQDNTVCALF